MERIGSGHLEETGVQETAHRTIASASPRRPRSGRDHEYRVSAVPFDLVQVKVEDVVDREELRILDHLASFRRVVPMFACMRAFALSIFARRLSPAPTVGTLDDERVLLDAKLHLVSPVQAQEIEERTVDDQPRAVADLGQSLGEHAHNISIRFSLKQPRVPAERFFRAAATS